MMRQFKNILLVMPESVKDPALIERIARLAQENKGRLTLADTVEAPPHSQTSVFADDLDIPLAKWMQMHRLLVKSKEKRLKQMAASLKKFKNLSVSTLLLQGRPSLEIVRDVVQKKRDLLVKPATPETGPLERLFGGLDTQLIRRTPCPVWIIKPRRRKPERRILAAVDPDPDDPVRHGLNRTILDIATSLSEMLDSELYIVHAWELPGENTLRYGEFRLSKKEVDKLVRQERQRRKKRLDLLLAQYPDQDLKQHVVLVKGDAKVKIPQVAQRKKAELVIMGTVCRTGIEGFFIGNTAEAVLHQIRCSVLTVKPEGFKSPIS